MGGITEYKEVPLYRPNTKPQPIDPKHPIRPGLIASPRDFKLCYAAGIVKKQLRCNKNYCFKNDRNCLLMAHESL